MKQRKDQAEWMRSPAWKLPSGKPLVEYALQCGFLAPLLMGNRASPVETPRKGAVGVGLGSGKVTR